MKAKAKLATLALATVFLVTSAAQAQVRRQESVVVFYTDDSYSTIAGQTVRFCDGGHVHVGSYTMYDQEIYYGCN